MKSRTIKWKAQTGTRVVNIPTLDAQYPLDNMLWGNMGSEPTPSVIANSNPGSVTDIYGNTAYNVDPNQQPNVPTPGFVMSREMRGTGRFTENPLVKNFNILATGITGFSNMLQNNRLRNREERQMLEAMEPQYYQNMEAEGLNNLPMYTKYGGSTYGGVNYPAADGGIGNWLYDGLYHSDMYGKTSMYKAGGDVTQGKAKEILKDGKIRGKKLTDKQKRFFGWVAGGRKQTGGDTLGPMVSDPQNPNPGTVPIFVPKDTIKTIKLGDKKKTTVNEGDIKRIASHAKAMGLDPYSVLAVGMQETNLNQPQGDFGNVDVDTYPDVPSSVSDDDLHIFYLTRVFKDRMREADQLVKDGQIPDTEEARLQVFNKNSKNPKYGKEAISIRETILKKNPDVRKAVEQAKPQVYKQGNALVKPDYFQTGGKADMKKKIKFKKAQAGTANVRMMANALPGQEQQQMGIDPNMSYYQTSQTSKDARLADIVNNLVAKGIDPYTQEGKGFLEIVPIRYGTPQFANDLSFKIKALQSDSGYKTMTPEQRLERFYRTTQGNTEFDQFVNRARTLGGSPGAYYQNSPWNRPVSGQQPVTASQPPISTAMRQTGGSVPPGHHVMPDGTLMKDSDMGLSETYGLPDGMAQLGNVNAEEGEVFQDVNGNVMKVADDAGTHEEGGVMLPNVDRVLEQTSTKRKDRASKLLALAPEEVEQMFGFRPKRKISHADAFEQAVDYYGKKKVKIQKNQEVINKRPVMDNYSAESAKLNFEHMDNLPTDDDVFDMLFGHQEYVKQLNEINDDGTIAGKPKLKNRPKAQAGTAAPNLGLYTGPQNRSGRNLYSPTGKTTEAKLSDQQIVEAYRAAGIELGDLRGRDLQGAIYNYLIENQPDVLRETLQEYGPNIQSEQMGLDNQRAFVDPMRATPDELRVVLPGLLDAMPGARIPLPSSFTETQSQYPVTVQEQSVPGNRSVNPGNPNLTINPQFRQQPDNRFHEATYWDELAPGLLSLADSMVRDPELYNPMEFNQLNLKQLDPTSTLNANQADYEAAANALSNMPIGSGASAANLANLSAQKHKVNANVLGEFANRNAAIKNQEIQYNTQVRDRQSMADAQTREKYYRNVQVARDNQRLQRMKAIEDLGRVIQMKRRQNRSGNMLLKLSPAFDQYGEYNGYQYMPVLPANMGFSQTPTPTGTTKGRPSTTTKTTTQWKVGDRVIKREVRD